MQKISHLEITQYYGRYFQVLDDFYYPLRKRLIMVKKYFITDLASIPRIFWSFYQPFGSYTLASIVHDYLYSKEGSRQVSCRKEADDIFLTIMEETAVPLVTRWIFYISVRLFGAFHYQKE